MRNATHASGEGWEAAGTVLVDGCARGQVLFADVGLSFWGGVDPQSGEIVDRNHPLHGCNVAGKIVAIPGGRGSCTGSSVLMELILNGHGPAGMVFSQCEDILALGVVVAEEMFGKSIPMVWLEPARFGELIRVSAAEIEHHLVRDIGEPRAPRIAPAAAAAPRFAQSLELTDRDRSLLEGPGAKATRVAMRIIVRMAAILGASRLIDVTQAHIDGCIYTGDASLRFARLLCEWGAEVAVPTSLNAISVDRRNWRVQGTPPSLGIPAADLADAYVQMGARPTFTCAPYQLATAPARGEHIAWAESNAVVYANSVLGARTMKYPDYLDICIALTGRAPLAGCHIEANRKATVQIVVPDFGAIDDSFHPLLGYHVGCLSPSGIPVVAGLDHLSPSPDDLKAFGAAFGTTSGAPMFHMLGVTPEAATLAEATGMRDDIPTIHIDRVELAASWRKLNSATESTVDLISLGNPHFSYAEFETLAALCQARKRHPAVAVVVTCGRDTLDRIARSGIEGGLREFGVRFVTDACWCTVVEPVIPRAARTIMTNSGKYAHYGPGLSGRTFHFGSLADCVDAACTGQAKHRLPAWLDDPVEPGDGIVLR